MALKITTSEMRSPCIYFLMDGNRVVYIGSTKNFYRRMHSHLAQKIIPFDNARGILVSSMDFARWYESRLINRFKPPHNVAYPVNVRNPYTIVLIDDKEIEGVNNAKGFTHTIATFAKHRNVPKNTVYHWIIRGHQSKHKFKTVKVGSMTLVKDLKK